MRRTVRRSVTPRVGLRGAWDSFIGPGATAAENGLIVTAAIAGAVWAPWSAGRLELGWTWVQMIVTALLALDIIGGVAANATATTKRWYHRPGQTARDHFRFVAFHVHPFLVGWLFLGGAPGWTFGTLVYGFLLGAAGVILAAPRELGRPLAYLLTLAGVVAGATVLEPVAGFAWFIPALLLKLLPGHLVPDQRMHNGEIQ